MEKRSWDEFMSTGLLLFLNQFLHIFGWCIVMKYGKDGKVKEVYPARTEWRGFNYEDVDKAYKNVSKYMSENHEQLRKEAEE